ncbi:MAG TPA: two-component regulator propeller domain-containing protein [Sediminibacterium sp.]|nr:two-component regulator propeller domain-containing protein [Sediminibacterium sp.]
MQGINHSHFNSKQIVFHTIKCLFLLAFIGLTSIRLSYGQENGIQPIGQWREHLSYRQALQVVKGNLIYCASNNAVFSISKEGNLNRYSKMNGLNDLDISALGWDQESQQLIVAYSNSNLDLVKGSIVNNIGDIKRSTIAGNKRIANIFCRNGFAYLSTGLGIVLADLQKYEIKDTWFLGKNGGQVSVFSVTSDATDFYAATEEGLKKAAIANPNLSNSDNWQLIGSANGLSTGAIQQVLTLNNKILALKNDSLFLQNNGLFSFFYTDKDWPISNVTVSSNGLQICQRQSSGASRVLALNETGNIVQNLSKPGMISFPKNAIQDGSAIWIADLFGGLSKFENNAYEQYLPNGPLGVATGDLVFQSTHLYAAAGSVNDAWNYQYNRNGVYDYQLDHWDFKGYFNQPILDSVLDFISLAIDPRDGAVWAGSYGGGLVRFKENQTSIFKQKNSSIQPALGDPNSYRVSGLAFDQAGNLWVANYGAAKNIQVRKTDSSWTSIRVPFSLTENALSQVLVDQDQQVWFISPKGNGIVCYSPGNSIVATNDDRWKNYLAGSGNGNLPSNNVRCMALDKNGFIWVGTDKGIGIIQCSYDVFGTGCEALLPVVQQDRFAGLLFQDEDVQTIAIDGANRKWVGTKNGLWLLSPEGDKIIYRFTQDNAPLLGNDIKKLAIEPISGELFIATTNGICSFRSTATEGGSTQENVLVFPNPVPAGYNGTIAIRGLSNNALVKITEPNGQLVYQTRALGGQAIWDGKQYTGTKAASGVYLVIVRDDSGKEKLVTKIVLLSGR